MNKTIGADTSYYDGSIHKPKVVGYVVLGKEDKRGRATVASPTIHTNADELKADKNRQRTLATNNAKKFTNIAKESLGKNDFEKAKNMAKRAIDEALKFQTPAALKAKNIAEAVLESIRT